MKQQTFWVPDPKVMDEDEKEFALLAIKYAERITEDFVSCGYPHIVWISEKRYLEDFHPLKAIVDNGECLRAFNGLDDTMAFGFKEVDEALLFKLTYGGR